MYLVRPSDNSDRLRKGLAAACGAGMFALLVFLEMNGAGAQVVRLAFLPIVIATAWFWGWEFALAALACVFVAKLNGGFNSLGESSLAHEQFLDTVIWLGECGIIAVLASLLRRARERTLDVAGRDPLTGLANQKALLERLAAEINRAQRTGRPLTLAYLDGDHFKDVNDTLGHAVGDELLREVARVLQTNVRSYDLVARVGGDEFAVLLPDTTPESARAAVERLRRALRLAMGAQQWPTTFSVGVATFKNPRQNAVEMVAAADQTMYLAKRTLRGSVQYVVPSA